MTEITPPQSDAGRTVEVVVFQPAVSAIVRSYSRNHSPDHSRNYSRVAPMQTVLTPVCPAPLCGRVGLSFLIGPASGEGARVAMARVWRRFVAPWR